MRCPLHRVALVLDERTVESVPDGLGGAGVERSFVVERFVCPVGDCAEQDERTAA